VVTVSQKRPSREIPRIARPVRPDELQFIDSTALSRYDVLLAIIPLALVAAWVIGHATAVPDWVALGAGGLLALPAVVDGVALNPPA
jgi:hypothetical protein